MARFIYYNVNPYGIEEDDCVTRAISLATDTPYREIRKKLILTAELLECEELCVCCYHHLIGYVYGGEEIECDGLNIGEFADMHPVGTYLVRIDGHLSTIIDNDVYDIWDCRGEICDIVWRIQKHD